MNSCDTALLFADRSGSELEPVNQFYPPALLPVAGKSPLEYWVEILSERGIRNAYIVVGPSSRLIKKQIGDGGHWGIKITYLTSRGDEKPFDLFNRHSSVLPTKLLAVRADVLPLLNTDDEVYPSVKLSIETQDKISDLLSTLNWSHINSESQNSAHLGNIQQYATAIWSVLNGTYSWLTPRGVKTASAQWLATPTFPASRTESMDSPVYVGKGAIVHRDTTLTNNFSIEEEALVDQNATIEDSVVLPGTYVGQGITIKDSIACGSFLIDISTGLARHVHNPAEICHQQQPSELVSTYVSECLFAATVLIITAPIVLPLAILKKNRGKALLQTAPAMSNQASRKIPLVFKLYSFNTKTIWLRRWPSLLNVIDGDLKLFGGPIAKPQHELPINLPLAQGVITVKDLFPRQAFNNMELELWGIELANKSKSFWGQLKWAYHQRFKSRLGFSESKPTTPNIHHK